MDAEPLSSAWIFALGSILTNLSGLVCAILVREMTYLNDSLMVISLIFRSLPFIFLFLSI